MNRERIQYSIGHNSFKFAVDGSEFRFDPFSPTSRQAAFNAMQEHASKVIEALDHRAGHKLTPRELLQGVVHPETRPDAERVKVTPQPQQPELNPYQHMIDAGLVGAKKESPKKRMERLAAEFEAKRLSEADRLAFANDPHRSKAVAHAEAELRRLRHDATITVEEMEEAESRVELARTGDLKRYAARDREWRKTLAEKLAERAAPIDQQIASLRQQKQDILDGAFDDPPPPVVQAPVEEPSRFANVPLVRMTKEESDAAFARDRELVARQKAAGK